MTVKIAIISDTHFNRWDEVHPKIREAVREADIAVHCGDIVRQDVVDGMRNEAKRAVIVHGNSDPARPQAVTPVHRSHRGRGSQAGRNPPGMGRPRVPPGRAPARLPRTSGRDPLRPPPRDHQRDARRNPVPQPGPGVQILHGPRHNRHAHRVRMERCPPR